MVIFWSRVHHRHGIVREGVQLVTGEGKEREENSRWSEQNRVAVMQKETDSDFLKMMQLQNQVVTTFQLNTNVHGRSNPFL